MAPNSRVVNAFRAMKAIGIKEAKVKPVLKELLKLYDKNWELIEAENYRVLADAIFEAEDTEVPEENEKVNQEDNTEDAQPHDEPERPLKRLRLRNQEEQVTPSNGTNPNHEENPEDAQPREEPERRLKRLRLRNQEEHVTPFNDTNPNAGGVTLKVPKEEKEQSPGSGTNSAQLITMRVSAPAPQTNMDKQLAISDSDAPQIRHSYKGKEPMMPEVSRKRKELGPPRPLQIRDSADDTGSSATPKHTVSDKFVLIQPKDEPYTDCMPLNGTPKIAGIQPDHNASAAYKHAKNVPASNSWVGGDIVENGSASENSARSNHEPGKLSEESSASIDIVTSSSGEVKLSLSCNSVLGRQHLRMPSQNELLKLMQEKCLGSYKILDPNFTVEKLLKDMCECFLELATDTYDESQEGFNNVTPILDLLKKYPARDTIGDGSCIGNKFAAIVLKPPIPRPLQSSDGIEQKSMGEGPQNEQVTYSRELVVVPESQISSDDFRSLVNFCDICKGEENVEIPWTNETNNELPPSFNYIPQSLVFQNAIVNFTLSQIKSGSCCPDCYGDCLSSPITCICAAEGDYKFAYTVEGLLKVDFLEDCVRQIRDPRALSYCVADCPLERWKNDDMLEPCKGHLKRKFIKECWTKCGCHKRCGNRVVQRGIQCKLQLFFTVEGKRWGLRTLQKLPKGAFVCEYAGEILTCKEWYERAAQEKGSTLSGLPNQPVLLDAFWCLKDNMMDGESLCLDSTYFGNVARFINHRCFDANLIEIPVKIETPENHYYHLAFFTTREVDAMEELTWDYGINFDDNDIVKAFPCKCGSKFCRNIKRGRRLRSASS